MRYSLVIFDMDGTLTEELLDFDAIRAEIGVTGSGGILEYIATLPPAERQQAQDILHRHEITAAQAATLLPDTAETLLALRNNGIQTALLTRNSPLCARTVLAKHNLLDFWHHISTRDDLPHKPHKDSILRITQKLGVPIRQTLMVGDYLYDVQAARNADCDSALLLTADEFATRPPYADLATYCIGSLTELLAIVNGANDENE